MKLREGEAERQAYITKRINDADTALREYANLHAHEIGLTEGRIEKIRSLQRISKQPLTPKRGLESPPANLIALADRLESEALSRIDTL